MANDGGGSEVKVGAPESGLLVAVVLVASGVAVAVAFGSGVFAGDIVGVDIRTVGEGVSTRGDSSVGVGIIWSEIVGVGKTPAGKVGMGVCVGTKSELGGNSVGKNAGNPCSLLMISTPVRRPFALTSGLG